MNRGCFLFAIILLLLSSCKNDLKRSGIIEDIKRDFNKSECYLAALIIPQGGCTGCISNAEEFVRNNIDNRKLLYIFTNIISEKELRAKLNMSNEPPANCYFDRKNQYTIPSGFEESDYPLIVYFASKNEPITESASPLNHGVYERLICKINNTPSKYSIEEIFETRPAIKGIGELSEKIKYIQFKSDSNNPISSFRKIVFDDDVIIISEDQAIHIFDTLGNFITRVGKRGRGPEEYTQLIGGEFGVDKNKNEVLLPDLVGHKVMIYDYFGRLKRIIKAKYFIDDVAVINDSLYCIKVQPALDSLKRVISLVIVNDEGKVKKEYVTCTAQKLNFMANDSFEEVFDEVLFREPYGDTIFRITPLLNKEVLGITDLGKYKPPVEVYKDISSWQANISKYVFNYYLVHDLYRTYFSIYFNMHVYCGEFRGFNNLPVLWYDGPQNDGIKDNLDFGPPFSPFLKINDGLMIDFIEPVELLKDDYDCVRQASDLYNIRKSMSPNDNPVIRIVKLK